MHRKESKGKLAETILEDLIRKKKIGNTEKQDKKRKRSWKS